MLCNKICEIMLFKSIYKSMLENIKSAYIIGVGGISMSAIARFLKSRGIEVYGSDVTYNEEIKQLIKDKIIVFRQFSAPLFVKKCDIVIFTSAVSDKNTDISYAKMLGKPIFSRAQILGELTKNKTTISISGTHGKTTTTGLVASVLLRGQDKPNIHIGGILKNINSNVLITKSDLFLTEACEYKDSFLMLHNFISVVLNIKPDHLDYFHNIENEFASFQKFVDNTDKNGYVIVNNDDEMCQKLVVKSNKITFAINNKADLQARNIKTDKKCGVSFDLYYKNKMLGSICMSCYGKHNVLNVLACSAVALALNIPFKQFKKGVKNYKGVERRFEILSKKRGNLIVHDYAHHPDEIKATLKLCKDIGYKKIIAIFQPHTFSRTRDLYQDFLKCFDDADETWLLPIYPAREKAIKGVTSYKLSKDLKKDGKNTRYLKNFDDCYENIIKNKEKSVIFSILGAGDIVELANKFKNKKK